MSIQRLNQGTLTAASQLPFFDPSNGVDRRGSVADLVALLQGDEASNELTQYAAPNATGFNVLVLAPEAGINVFLLLTPAAGYAAGTITLPPVADCFDGLKVQVSCTQAVTALTTAGNGATVNGAPTTLAANAFFRLRFDGVFKAWYRAG